MSQLCSIEDVELYLQTEIDGNASVTLSDTNQVEMLIDSISSEIRSITSRNLTAEDYDTSFDMDGSEVILEDYPLQSITTVSYGSPFGSTARTEIDSTDYITYDNIGVIGLQQTFRRAKQWVNVIYRAGYEEGDPAFNDITLKTVKAVVAEMKDTNIDINIDGQLKSIKTGDATNTYFSDGERSEVSRSENLRSSFAQYIKSVF